MFVAETIITIALACRPNRRSSGTHDITFDSTDYGTMIVTSNKGTKVCGTSSLSTTLENALAKDFAGVPVVRHVLTEWADGQLLVWVAIDETNFSVRQRIYQKELEMIDGFPEIEFDFNLVNAVDRPADEIATGAFVAYSRLN